MLISEIYKLLDNTGQRKTPVKPQKRTRMLQERTGTRQKARTLLTEGGNAVEGVSRINQENVQATLQDIYSKLLPILGISQKDTALLGSTGKKLPGGTSGDMDLAIDRRKVMRLNQLQTGEDMYKFLIHAAERMGYQFNWLKGLDILSIGWPIANTDGKQEGETVQLDIMPVDNLKMAAWGMASPHQSQEQYKGAVRGELLYWIASEVDYKALKQVANELTGEMEDLEFERTIFNGMKGLYRIKQTYLSPKSGKRMKNKATVARKLTETNPVAIAKLLLGPSAEPDNLISAKQIWDAMMSDEFPYPDKRKAIVKNAIASLTRAGIDYPPYFDEFVDTKPAQLTERAQTTFDSPRKSMTKIHQMKADEFVQFLQALKDKGVIDSKKFDLSEFNASEKADGQGVRLICYDGKIGIESSYSGVVFNPGATRQECFRETLLYFQNEHTDALLRIAKKHNSWYKITGELFYMNDPEIIDDDSGVTFVATKYDSKKMGKIGAMVVFDVSGITPDGQLEKLEPETKKAIMREFKLLNNQDFRIYDDTNFNWSGEINIEIDYDTEMMNRIFQEPSVLLTKQCRTHFQELRQAIADAFSREIRKKGSVLGMSDSEVEGIVFEINGQKYGATNFNWAENKKALWKSQDAFFNRIAEFLKMLTGFVKREKVYSLLKAPDAKIHYELTYQKELPGFLQDMQQLKDAFDADTTIPRALKKQQSKFLNTAYKKVMKLQPRLSSLRAFVRPT